jgi:hypothetical protein
VNLQIIFPANDDLIKKKSSDKNYVVRESFKTYKEITKPLFVDKIDHLKFNEWIYNILDGKKEKDLRVFENDQFYFNKDWAFNQLDLSSLYCLAIPR